MASYRCLSFCNVLPPPYFFLFSFESESKFKSDISIVKKIQTSHFVISHKRKSEIYFYTTQDGYISLSKISSKRQTRVYEQRFRVNIEIFIIIRNVYVHVYFTSQGVSNEIILSELLILFMNILTLMGKFTSTRFSCFVFSIAFLLSP